MAESMIFTLEMFEDAREYWEEKLSGDLAGLNLAADFPGFGSTGNTGEGVYKISMGTAVSETLFRISKNNDLALFVILAAAFKVLLFKFTGQTDIIITSPTLKQSRQSYNKFVALRDYPRAGMTFKEFLMKTRKTAVEGYKYQFYPIRKLIKFLKIENTALLFKVMMLLDTIHRRDALDEVRTGFKNDILVSFSKENGNLNGEVFYNSGVYKPGTIHRLMDIYRELLAFVLNNMESDISGIEIFSGGEKKRILYEFNDTHREFPRDKTLHQLFIDQVEKTPELEAVVDIGSGEPEPPAVTYRQLDEKSHRLASVLKSKGVKPGTLVAILVEPAIDVIAGMIAILKAGCVYLPIDPDYPLARIDYILKDSQAKMLLTGSGVRKKPVGEERLIEILDISGCLSEPVSTVVSDSREDSSSLAYVLYTSGTTGTPKGVMVTHRNVVRLVRNPNYIVLEQGQRLLLTGVMTFDITTFEIWAPLLNGLSLYLANENTILDPGRLGEVLAANRISILHLVPQLFNQIAAASMEIFGELKYLLVGGDLVKPRYLNRLRNKYKHLNILHMYGPTENTTFTTFFPVEQEYKTGIPIGKPVSNTVVYILDHYGRLLPVGAVGELYTGGEGVARGYLNNPVLTLERFINYKSQITNKTVPGDISEHLNQKLLRGVQGGGFLEKNPPGRRRQNVYKTGDLARWLLDGNIEFLGRVDQQVKVRGIRIEPGEIEAILIKLPRVKEVLVTVREIPGRGNKEDGIEETEKSLCAYLVIDEEPDLGGVKNHLSGYLPAYMLPQYFIRVSAIPLTPNGKVDHRALPEPRITVEERYAAPANELEEELVEIWAQVLGIEKDIIGVFTSFFDLGGHSLKATVLITRIHKAFSVRMPLMEFFKIPTIRGLAGYIKQAEAQGLVRIQPVEKREYFALSSAQQRLYFLQQMELGSTVYNLPRFLHFRGEPDLEKLEYTFKKLLSRHESLRTSFDLVGDRPVQRIHKQIQLFIEKYESGKAADFVRPFDLAREPLIRVGISSSRSLGGGKEGINRGGGSESVPVSGYTLMVDLHHIIIDGLSDAILVKDFLALYSGEELPVLKLQYKEFSTWQNRLIESGEIKKQEAYWRKVFEKEPQSVKFPTDYEITVVKNFTGAHLSIVIGREETEGLKQIARAGGSTLYMVILTLFNIFLWKISGLTDFIIATPVAGRRHADLENIVGMLVNTLLLRNYPGGEKQFSEFLQEVKERTLAAFENQDFQCEELPEQQENLRNILHIGFSFQEIALPLLQKSEAAAIKNINNKQNSMLQGKKQPKPILYENNTSKGDLSLNAVEMGDILYLSFEYAVSVFKEESIRRYSHYLQEIISAVVKDKDIKLKDISISHGLLKPGAELLQEAQGDFGF